MKKSDVSKEKKSSLLMEASQFKEKDANSDNDNEIDLSK